MILLSRLVKKSLPLRVHISTMFLLLVFFCCCSLSYLFYSQSREMINTEVDQRLARILKDATTDLERLSAPPTAVVNLISNTQIVDHDGYEQRAESIPFLIEALKAADDLSSVYVGYPDGDFFMLRRVQDKTLKRFFDAPDAAVWMAQSIDHRAGDVSKQFVFFAEGGNQIETRVWETDFDPRIRPWYELAAADSDVVRGDPYIFYTDRKIGMTFSKRIPSGAAVIGADLKLETLSSLIENHKITPHTQVVLLDQQSRLIACEDAGNLIRKSGEGPEAALERGTVADLREPVLDQLMQTWQKGGRKNIGKQILNAAAGSWIATIVELNHPFGSPVYLGLAIPNAELLAEVQRIMTQAGLLGLAIILAMIPLTLGISRGIARPLNTLAEDADRVRRFDFSETETVHSYIKEVDDLASAMAFTKLTVSEFLRLLESINREKNFDSLLNRLVDVAGQAAEADGTCIYLLDSRHGQLNPANYSGKLFDTAALPSFSIQEKNPLVDSVTDASVKTWYITDKSSNAGDEVLFKTCGETAIRCIPLYGRQKDIYLGAICLFYCGSGDSLDIPEYRDRLLFVEQFSEFTGVTLQTKQLIDQQKALFEAFIDLIVEAIDAKSPYTGEHCQRVPIIASMLAAAVCGEKHGILSGYDWSDDEWEELRVAAKLHDCGKITTPEFVVDKATKLETIYNRIHEIRMRFEVIRRDAEIAYWQQLADGGDKQELLEKREQLTNDLADEFAFVAACNVGGEFLADDALERLQAIGQRTWQRYFDDRLGVSWEEHKRKERGPVQALPVTEALLDDKEEHLIARSEADHIEKDNPWGFKLEEPQFLYNRGELYNLSVKRGTLSDEERYKINDHIVQTIKMLETLPFPDHLQAVPEIAGGHHETMTGTGYPRQLRGEQMSIRARIMVIADVFEALTASGRPYKKAKRLSEAIAIMGSMHKGGHFDRDLFRLFLTSGIYKEYAHQYLEKEQIDDVEIDQYL